MVAVNAWDEPADTVAAFVKAQGIKYPMLLSGSRIGRSYGFEGIPMNYFLDPDGKIAAEELGFPGRSALEKKVAALVGEKRG